MGLQLAPVQRRRLRLQVWVVRERRPLLQRLFGSLLVLAAVGALGACSPAPQKGPRPLPPVAPKGVELVFPLEDATVYSYDTLVEPTGEQGLLVLEVRRRRPEAADLIVAGRAQRLNVTRDAIEYVTGGFLLKAPLVPGAEFRGDFGVVKVMRVGFSTRVPAGEFGECVETVETSQDPNQNRITTTIFCARAGIVSRRTEAESDAGHAVESMKLKSFGKKFEFPK
jgi:hypothetical protein